MDRDFIALLGAVASPHNVERERAEAHLCDPAHAQENLLGMLRAVQGDCSAAIFGMGMIVTANLLRQHFARLAEPARAEVKELLCQLLTHTPPDFSSVQHACRALAAGISAVCDASEAEEDDASDGDSDAEDERCRLQADWPEMAEAIETHIIGPAEEDRSAVAVVFAARLLTSAADCPAAGVTPALARLVSRVPGNKDSLCDRLLRCAFAFVEGGDVPEPRPGLRMGSLRQAQGVVLGAVASFFAGLIELAGADLRSEASAADGDEDDEEEEEAKKTTYTSAISAARSVLRFWPQILHLGRDLVLGDGDGEHELVLELLNGLVESREVLAAAISSELPTHIRGMTKGIADADGVASPGEVVVGVAQVASVLSRVPGGTASHVAGVVNAAVVIMVAVVAADSRAFARQRELTSGVLTFIATSLGSLLDKPPATPAEMQLWQGEADHLSLSGVAKSLRPLVAEVVDALCEAIALVVSAIGFKLFESLVLPFVAAALASDEITRRRVGLMVLAHAINGTDGASLLPLARSLAAAVLPSLRDASPSVQLAALQALDRLLEKARVGGYDAAALREARDHGDREAACGEAGCGVDHHHHGDGEACHDGGHGHGHGHGRKGGKGKKGEKKRKPQCANDVLSDLVLKPLMALASKEVGDKPRTRAAALGVLVTFVDGDVLLPEHLGDDATRDELVKSMLQAALDDKLSFVGRTYGCHVTGCIATALGARFRPYYAAVREVTLRLCAGCDDGAIPLWKRSLASYALQTQCIAMAAVGRAVSAEDTELAFGAASDLVAGAKAAAAYADEEPHAGLRALSPDERVWKHRARLLRAHLEEVHHLVGPSVARLISALGPDAVRGVAGILPVVLESAGREVPVLKVEAAQLAGGPAEDASGIDDDASEGSVDEEEEDEEEDEEEEEEEGDGGWAIHRREKPAEAAARLLGVDLNQAARSKELNEVYYLSAEGAVMRGGVSTTVSELASDSLHCLRVLLTEVVEPSDVEEKEGKHAAKGKRGDAEAAASAAARKHLAIVAPHFDAMLSACLMGLRSPLAQARGDAGNCCYLLIEVARQMDEAAAAGAGAGAREAAVAGSAAAKSGAAAAPGAGFPAMQRAVDALLPALSQAVDINLMAISLPPQTSGKAAARAGGPAKALAPAVAKAVPHFASESAREAAEDLLSALEVCLDVAAGAKHADDDDEEEEEAAGAGGASDASSAAGVGKAAAGKLPAFVSVSLPVAARVLLATKHQLQAVHERFKDVLGAYKARSRDEAMDDGMHEAACAAVVGLQRMAMGATAVMLSLTKLCGGAVTYPAAEEAGLTALLLKHATDSSAQSSTLRAAAAEAACDVLHAAALPAWEPYLVAILPEMVESMADKTTLVRQCCNFGVGDVADKGLLRLLPGPLLPKAARTCVSLLTAAREAAAAGGKGKKGAAGKGKKRPDAEAALLAAAQDENEEQWVLDNVAACLLKLLSSDACAPKAPEPAPAPGAEPAPAAVAAAGPLLPEAEVAAGMKLGLACLPLRTDLSEAKTVHGRLLDALAARSAGWMGKGGALLPALLGALGRILAADTELVAKAKEEEGEEEEEEEEEGEGEEEAASEGSGGDMSDVDMSDDEGEGGGEEGKATEKGGKKGAAGSGKAAGAGAGAAAKAGEKGDGAVPEKHVILSAKHAKLARSLLAGLSASAEPAAAYARMVAAALPEPERAALAAWGLAL